MAETAYKAASADHHVIFTRLPLNHDFGSTLCIYSNTTMFTEALDTMKPLDRNRMMKSPSAKLMLGIDGLKTAATHATEIYQFLNS